MKSKRPTGRKTLPAKGVKNSPLTNKNLPGAEPPRHKVKPMPERGTKKTEMDDMDEPVSTPSGLLFSIVGIGASAGGFEAASELISHLPKDTGMAFVVIQHLASDHPSQLADLLQRNSQMPVTEAHHKQAVLPDNIYVIPPNVTMTLAGGEFKLVKRRSNEIPPMPVDHFLRSLAEQHQDRAVGVVLSGTGTDGTLGLDEIKGLGGVTFAQDEATAKFFGMPGSAIAARAVDFVLSPKGIAEQLVRLAQHPYLRRPSKPQTKPEKSDWEKMLHDSGRELSSIFALLRARTGVDFSLYKHTTLKRRIVRRMILHKQDALPQYVHLLETNPVEVDALFNDLLINVTSFFRDPQAFQVLKQKIFPRVLKAHTHDSPLRMWVCGCSTGQEAYSLAISMVEYFDKTHSHRPVQIFATDISDAGIEKAREGIYPESIMQDVSPERLRRFFTKVDGHYQVHKSIRDMCIFARQNVIMDPPFSNLDLISCRNVLIYLGPVLQQKIIPVFHYALRPTGFLLLGNSETIGSSTELFALFNKKHKIYTKKPTFFRPAFDIPNKNIHAETKQKGAPESLPMPEVKIPDLQQQADKILLRDFSPGAVVINAQMDVLHFRGRTGDYLEHAPGAASLNLLKMARENLVIDLRAAVTKAIKTNAPVQQKGIQLRRTGHTREVSIDVIPFRLTPSSERFFLVLFKDGAESEEKHHEHSAPSRAKPAQEKRVVARLKQELVATKESLQAIIEEQEATNEELKSANEEIQSSNEELQSTNEELETAKEELQSTNEELTTLNEELQNRNTELSAVNNDLTNLLSSVNVAILMLGNDLIIRRFTPMAERLFNLIPSDVGRRLSDMNRSVLVPDLDSAIQDVIDNLVSIEREVQDREGRWYSLRIRPYRTRENKIDGAVILLVDIDELKRALESVLTIVRQPLLVVGADLRVRKANESFYKTFGLRGDEVDQKILYEIGGGQWNIPKLQTLMEAILPESKQVDNYEIEGHFGSAGHKRIRIHARRFHEDIRGLQAILLAMEEVTESP